MKPPRFYREVMTVMAGSRRRSQSCTPPRRLRLESLESRRLLAAGLVNETEFASEKAIPAFNAAEYLPNDAARAEAAVRAVTTTNSTELAQTGPVPGNVTFNEFATQSQSSSSNSGDNDGEQPDELPQSTTAINLDQFRNDARFAGIDGTGFGTVIIDTGIDLDHPHFGPDGDNDGVADRIVHQQSFIGLATGDDLNGHGTHVASTVASSDATLTGMAPGAGVIALQTNNQEGRGSFGGIEQALQWVIANVSTFNIASVNMSLGDGGNDTEAVSRYGIGDELAALEAMDVIVVSSSGNSFGAFGGAPGVGYPSSDPNSLSIGSRRTTSLSASGFSQRHPELTTVFAPGNPITAGWLNGGTRSISGTSMASPHVSGVATLMQQLAVQELGRRLTFGEFEALVRSSAFDFLGIPSTGASYGSLDVFALGEAVLAMAVGGADLHGTSFTTSAGLERGQAGSASVSVQNLGMSDASDVTVDFYLSTNGSISTTGDISLGSTTIDTILGGNTESSTLDFTLPSPNDPFWLSTSDYTIGAVIDQDNTIGEADEGNNFNLGVSLDKLDVTIANPPADLVGNSFTIDQASGVRGEDIDVRYSVSNLGAGPTYAGDVEFYLSADGVIDPVADVLLGSADLDGILAGATSDEQSITFTLPENADSFWQAAGPYTIGMIVDAAGTVTESDESNNSNVGPDLDLKVIDIVPPPTTIRGATFLDRNGDGQRASGFDGPVTLSAGAGGDIIRPNRTATFVFNDIAPTNSSATLRVQAVGDIDEVTEFATITIDGTVVGNVFDKEPLDVNGFFATGDETLVLDDMVWLDAIADGNLTIEVNFTNPGGFATGSANWMRITLDYDGASSSRTYDSEIVENRTWTQRTTNVALDGSKPPVGDGRLTLYALGDVGGTEETATIDLEGLASFTLLDDSDGTGDMAGAVGYATIPLATLQQLVADGTVGAQVSFSSAVDNFFPGNMFEIRLDYPIDVEPGVGGVDVMLDVDGDGVADQTVTTAFDDPSTAFDEAGAYEFVDIGSGDFELTITAPQGSTITAPATGEQDLTLIEGELLEGVEFGVMGSFEPSVEVVTLGGGLASRSQLTGFEVSVNGRVDPALILDGITLTNTTDDVEVTSLLLQSQFVGDQTLISVEFADGPSVETRAGVGALGNSLADGNYRLQIAADALLSNLGQTMATDFTFGDVATDNFFRFYGDDNGDRDTDGQDYGVFGSGFLKTVGQTGYKPELDFDGDGDIDGQELGQFARRFFQVLDF
ncbi:MAG: S8 family serine peptidase [Planctomycetota bacterium]